MRPREKQSRNLRSIVDRIRPSVEALLATELSCEEALVRHAGEATSGPPQPLRHGRSLEPHQATVTCRGAEYSLETGVVDFFDGVPEAG